MSQKEVIKNRMRSLIEKMQKLRLEYSGCEDQLSDLSSDLDTIERREKEIASNTRDEEE